MKWENDTFLGRAKRQGRAGLVLRMRQMVYSSKDFNFIDFCHDSAKYASIMALAAPKVEEPLVDFPLWVVELNLQHKSTEFMK